MWKIVLLNLVSLVLVLTLSSMVISELNPCLTGACLNAIVHGHPGTEPGPCLTGACLNAIVHGHLETEPGPCLTGGINSLHVGVCGEVSRLFEHVKCFYQEKFSVTGKLLRRAVSCFPSMSTKHLSKDTGKEQIRSEHQLIHLLMQVSFCLHLYACRIRFRI